MITDDIMDAANLMQELCKSKKEAYGMGRMIEMLADLDVDIWPSMDSEERQKWISRYL